MQIGIIQNRPGIGDMCLFLPFIQLIAKKYKKKVIIFTKKRSKAKEVLKYDPHISKVLYIDEVKNNHNLELIKLIKEKKITKIFIFHFGIRFWFLSILAGVQNINFYGFFKKKVSINQFIKKKICLWLNIKNLTYKCKIYIPKYKASNNIIIGIGGSGINKKWPIRYYIELIYELKKRNYKNFIIAGGNNERKDFYEIFNKINNVRFKNLCNLSIADSMKIIAGSKYYIGNDTGFMHICASLNIKSFGLFGDTPSDYADYNKLIIPVMPKGYSVVSYNHNLMNKISPKDVLKILRKNKVF